MMQDLKRIKFDVNVALDLEAYKVYPLYQKFISAMSLAGGFTLKHDKTVAVFSELNGHLEFAIESGLPIFLIPFYDNTNKIWGAFMSDVKETPDAIQVDITKEMIDVFEESSQTEVASSGE
jgi:hypothetical protein